MNELLSKQINQKSGNLIANYYKDLKKNLLEGSIMIQNSYSLSFLSNINSKAIFIIIDLLFLFPDIPITFSEKENEIFKTNYIYKIKPNNTNINNNQIIANNNLRKIMKEIGKENEKEKINISSNNICNLILKNFPLLINMNKNREVFLDNKKIKNYYNFVRKLRINHESISQGKLIFLKTLDKNNNLLNIILSFARQTSNEIGIFIINFNEEETTFNLDLSVLFGKKIDLNTIIYVENWKKEKEEGKYYFFGDLNQTFINRNIEGFHSLFFGLNILEFNEDNYKRALKNKKQNININNKFDDYHLIIQLKEILNNKYSLAQFNEWLSNLSLYLKNNSEISLSNIIKKILTDLLSQENLIPIFSSYLKKSTSEIANKIIEINKLGLICFITPEIGRWSTIGGLGVMVDELTQGLSSLNQEVLIISPYYYQNRNGLSNYLSNDPFNFRKIKIITINLDTHYTFDIYHGKGNNNINYYFLFNEKIFPKAYPNFPPSEAVKEISCFAKGSLQLLYELNKRPDIIVTNDWFCGLIPAYGKNRSFGDFYEKTTFFHIIHNLDPQYEGRIYLSNKEDNLENIYKFDPFWLIDPNWKEKIINPSRSAIMMSDQWGTVSHSYKKDLLENSPLNNLLKKKQKPFSYPNGIYIAKRLKNLKAKGLINKEQCKKYIQQKYFLFNKEDLSIPLYSFIGRITKQKGVLLILNSVEDLIKITEGKISILIGGIGDKSDPYVKECIQKINFLKNKYNKNFWANPDIYFPEVEKVNMGSDFALMPSLFEPGGIVQHEFFIAKTPVIAFRTGGLKDTVIEFNFNNNTGNGFFFEKYCKNEFIEAIKRSLDLFKNKKKFEICKENAFKSVIDVANVSKQWCREFYRLKDKFFFGFYDEIEEILE